MVPPVTVISPFSKSVAASERVNVNVAVSPAFKSLSLEEIVIVGSTVSTAMVTVLETKLLFPAASMNLDGFTLISAFPVMSSVGVNIAV